MIFYKAPHTSSLVGMTLSVSWGTYTVLALVSHWTGVEWNTLAAVVT